jgi:hypothetical protein
VVHNHSVSFINIAPSVKNLASILPYNTIEQHFTPIEMISLLLLRVENLRIAMCNIHDGLDGVKV